MLSYYVARWGNFVQIRTVEKLYKQLEIEILHWVQEIDKYNHDPLWSKYEPDEWSIGQMYSFLIHWGLDVLMPAIDQAAENTNQNKKKTFLGKRVFWSGRIVGWSKMQLDAPLEKKTPEELKDRLIKLLKELSNRKQQFEKSQGKSEYSVYGFLDTSEWLKLATYFFKYFEKKKQKVQYHLL